MSVQFGTWSFDGRPLLNKTVEMVDALLTPYGSANALRFIKAGVSILYQPFNTTKESTREQQPHISSSGTVFTWDGRLDNRKELFAELRGGLVTNETDLQIVVEAYEKWGTGCLEKLIGDWALSIYNPNDRCLLLAKDAIGPRHLYYLYDDRQVSWCTILEPLLRMTNRRFRVCEEYIAGWLACFPAAHLTPYLGIEAVPPACYLTLRPGKRTQIEYWQLDPGRKIRYRTDAEYEEHFRTVLAKAVSRRLRSQKPVLAELSGGIDSASIVCMADIITNADRLNTTTVDTMSWYDESDESRNELPYLRRVEEQRGRKGFHLNLTIERSKRVEESMTTLFEKSGSSRLRAVPHGSQNPRPRLFGLDLAYLRTREYQVVLSGIGGEDVTGGYLPTPVPELQDLLLTGRLFRFSQQLFAWSTKMKRPASHLLWKTVRAFAERSVPFPWATERHSAPPWIEVGFAKRNQPAFRWYDSRINLFKGLPSFQHQVHLLSQARRFLAHTVLPHDPVREIRYPYLDREFIEFAAAIPRQQLVGVGTRRFLMKRALAGIVPDEILNRKRRNFPSMTINSTLLVKELAQTKMGGQTMCSSLGIINPEALLRVLKWSNCALNPFLNELQRSLLLEAWLQNISTQSVFAAPTDDGSGNARFRSPSKDFETSSVRQVCRYSQ